MALIKLTYRSKALNLNTAVNIILPEDCPRDDITTVYLLHGMHGNHDDWCRKTSIERYAGDRHLAIVMPDGENAFYTDMKYGKKYYTYVAKELPEYLRRVFRLSDKREKNFICGLSMGGYGSLRIALKNPRNYAACASLSGCVDIAASLSSCAWSNEAAAIWGDGFKTDVAGTDGDIFRLASDLAKTDEPKPRIYFACGLQDSLYGENAHLLKYLSDDSNFSDGKKYDFRYEEGDGVHNWIFWDEYVVHALDFFIGK